MKPALHESPDHRYREPSPLQRYRTHRPADLILATGQLALTEAPRTGSSGALPSQAGTELRLCRFGDPCALSAYEDAGLEIVTIVRRRRRARIGMQVTA